MNKMAEVAKIFGVELGERFDILNDECKRLRYTFFFDKDGLKYDGINGEWIAEDIFQYLFTGAYHIKEKPWKASYGEQYYLPRLHPTDKFFFVGKNICTAISDDWYNLGLMCKTQEQAEELAQLLIKTARKFQGFDDEEELWKK